mgnify:FL=1
MNLDNMGSKRASCTVCSNTSVTDCDKTGLPACRECVVLIPVSGGGLEVVLYKHAHIKYRRKYDAIRETHYGKKEESK